MRTRRRSTGKASGILAEVGKRAILSALHGVRFGEPEPVIRSVILRKWPSLSAEDVGRIVSEVWILCGRLSLNEEIEEATK